MISNLEAKRVVVFGLQGSGKTNFVKYLLSNIQNHIVFDTLKEYQGFNRYIPTDRNSTEEFNFFLEQMILKKKVRCIAIDECNRFCLSKPTPLPKGMLDLNDFNRHLDITLISIARRPTQLHSDLTELAHFKVFFKLAGKNDLQYMAQLHPELPDAVLKLNEFEYAILDYNNNIKVYPPCPLM
jgi:hypothetical protein